MQEVKSFLTKILSMLQEDRETHERDRRENQKKIDELDATMNKLLAILNTNYDRRVHERRQSENLGFPDRRINEH